MAQWLLEEISLLPSEGVGPVAFPEFVGIPSFVTVKTLVGADENSAKAFNSGCAATEADSVLKPNVDVVFEFEDEEAKDANCENGSISFLIGISLCISLDGIIESVDIAVADGVLENEEKSVKSLTLFELIAVPCPWHCKGFTKFPALFAFGPEFTCAKDPKLLNWLELLSDNERVVSWLVAEELKLPKSPKSEIACWPCWTCCCIPACIPEYTGGWKELLGADENWDICCWLEAICILLPKPCPVIFCTPIADCGWTTGMFSDMGGSASKLFLL